MCANSKVSKQDVPEVAEKACGQRWLEWKREKYKLQVSCPWAREMKLFGTEELSSLGSSQYISREFSQEYPLEDEGSG